jgi:hypothetical protein
VPLSNSRPHRGFPLPFQTCKHPSNSNSEPHGTTSITKPCPLTSPINNRSVHHHRHRQ